jgi:hypothetical protein
MKKFDENQIISQEEMNHISLREACEMVSLEDPYNHDRVMRRLIGCFAHKGYDRIDQFKDVTIFDLIVNVPKNHTKRELTNGYRIRRGAIDHNIPLMTNVRLAKAFIEAFTAMNEEDIKIKSWQEYNA